MRRAGVGFGRALDQLAVDALELVADPDQPRVDVDVGPPQPEDLAAAQAVVRHQGQCRVERVFPGGVEEVAQLVERPQWAHRRR